MNKMRLIVDSSCDLPEADYEMLDIGVTDLLINFGERTYRDRKDITTDEILKIYKEKKILPKTSALNIQDLTDVFEENLKHYDHLFYLPISSGISSIYNNARIAAQSFGGKVTPLDSSELSSGTALLALGIVRDIAKGLSPEEIEKNHYDRVKKVNMSFVIESMEFLYKGGRCSGLTFLLGNKLHLHPIIALKDGKMGVHKISRGKDISRGIDEMIDEFKKNLDQGNIDTDYPVFIPNVKSPHGVRQIEKALSPLIGKTILYPVDASGIICCHCGEDTCGLGYMMKEAPQK